MFERGMKGAGMYLDVDVDERYHGARAELATGGGKEANTCSETKELVNKNEGKQDGRNG